MAYFSHFLPHSPPKTVKIIPLPFTQITFFLALQRQVFKEEQQMLEITFLDIQIGGLRRQAATVSLQCCHRGDTHHSLGYHPIDAVLYSLGDTPNCFLKLVEK